MKKAKFPWGTKVLPKPEQRTPIIYSGGKTLIADWILEQLPPHRNYVEVFGGGGAVILAKGLSEVNVYNDIGNVSRFFSVLQNYGEELYQKLYFTTYNRELFYWANKNWPILKERAIQTKAKEDILEWATAWYIQILQSYTHSENDDSWIVQKANNGATPIRRHIDSLPYVCERLREVTIEHLSFERLIPLYDHKDTLFYCDPPYMHDSREANSLNLYEHEMSMDQHEELLDILNKIKGQCVVSGYEHSLYENATRGWRVARKVRKSQMHNSMQDVGMRTEVLYIKEHQRGIWTFDSASSDVSGVQVLEADTPEFENTGREVSI
jgi:DNA adenine methylase